MDEEKTEPWISPPAELAASLRRVHGYKMMFIQAHRRKKTLLYIHPHVKFGFLSDVEYFQIQSRDVAAERSDCFFRLASLKDSH